MIPNALCIYSVLVFHPCSCLSSVCFSSTGTRTLAWTRQGQLILCTMSTYMAVPNFRRACILKIGLCVCGALCWNWDDGGYHSWSEGWIWSYSQTGFGVWERYGYDFKWRFCVHPLVLNADLNLCMHAAYDMRSIGFVLFSDSGLT